jgi:hypothetical protein
MATRHAALISVVSLLLSALSAGPAAAQLGDQAAAPPVLTLLSSPPGASISIKGPTEVYGHTPMDLPSSVVGRFSMLAQGGGVARTQGEFEFGTLGERPTMVSEGPGMGPTLFLRSLNFPGFPDISAKRTTRGIVLTLAEVGALGMAAGAHVRYRNHLNESGAEEAIFAREERRIRNSWLAYGGAVWMASAVDYWMLPRFTVDEATANRLSLGIPTLSRAKVALRSLIVPGAGQEFANHGGRGALWMAGVLAAGVGYTAAHQALVHKRALLELNRLRYDAATDPSEQLRFLREIGILHQDIRTAEDVRRGFGYGTLVIHAANLIDAMMLPLGPPAVRTAPRVSAAFSPFGPQVALHITY